MKKKVAILGSTGSIGKTLLNIINKDKKNFEVKLLTARKNYKDILHQAKIFNVKNIIISDKKNYKIAQSNIKNKNIKIYNSYKDFDKIFKNKIDYTMSSFSGIDGLSPTIDIIKHTKYIAIANKEAIICGWNLLHKELKKCKTVFLPVDSEHFSTWFALRSNHILNIEKIYLTASGGPFKNLPINKFKKIKIEQALKHPNWQMGKKISIDSATMMNKVFEIIEAKNIFNVDYKKLDILIHPDSYIHAIIKFNNGLIKIVAHDTTMKIPIFNTLYYNLPKALKTTKVDINKLNNIKLSKVNLSRFPIIGLISILPNKHSLFETVIVSANDELVELFLEKKIKFTDISINLFKLLNLSEFKKYKNIQPNNINKIIKLNKYVRSKIRSISI
jgi:1-deoxy-D-xylulose-5-phosphate reductoisomerase